MLFLFFNAKVLLFVFLGLWIFILDVKEMRIPLFAVFLLSFSLFFDCIFFYRNLILENLSSAFLSFFIFLMCRKLTGNGLGKGDVLYAFPCGFFCGLCGTFLSIFISSLLCGIFFIVKVIINPKNKSFALPFCPFMFIGSLVSYFFVC